ncbi:hypothetical protein PG996_007887 [Apiospora saccharicola]|uniref:Mid2 domain-containing protein n=1 Tax=Apiospora saccharicola TaxID=335842 RepID=A0ABR1UWF5_9PEZI
MLSDASLTFDLKTGSSLAERISSGRSKKPSDTLTGSLPKTPTQTTSTHTPTTAPSGLSTGVIVGIVIGCTIPSMAIVVAVFLIFRRRKRRDNRSQPEPDSVEVSASPIVPTSGYQGNDQRQHELDASQDPRELSNDQQKHETDASQDPTELLGEQIQQEMDARPPPSKLPVEAASSSRD